MEGDLFTDPENVVITVEDIYLQDIGTAAHTQFNNIGEEVIDMYDEHPEWMKCRMGLIHSHNTMSVFFSPEDVSELEDNCPGTDFYFSLITNNRGQYTARAAYMQEVEIISEHKISYLNTQKKLVIESKPTTSKSKRMIMVEFKVEVSEGLPDNFCKRMDSIIGEHNSKMESRKSLSKDFKSLQNEWEGHTNNPPWRMPSHGLSLEEADDFDNEILDEDFHDNWKKQHKIPKHVSDRQVRMFDNITEGEAAYDSLIAKILSVDENFAGTIGEAVWNLGNDNNPKAAGRFVVEHIDTIYSRLTGKKLQWPLERRIVRTLLDLESKYEAIEVMKKELREYYQEMFTGKE